MFQHSISVFSTTVHIKIIHPEAKKFADLLKPYVDYHWDFRVQTLFSEATEDRIRFEVLVQKGALSELWAAKDVANSFLPQLKEYINYCIATHFQLAGEAKFDDEWFEVCNDAKVLNMTPNQVSTGEIHMENNIEMPVAGSQHYMQTGRFSNSPDDPRNRS